MNKRTLYPFGIIILSLFMALCTVPSINAAEVDTNDPLLNILPADCMFCFRINNFNGSLGTLDQYLAGVSPIPVSLAMLVNMQLGAVIGDPMLTGIDQGGDYAVFAIPPQGDKTEPVTGILIPVTDYKTFVSTNPNCKVGTDGTTLLSAPNSLMGGFAMKEAGQGKYALVVSELAKEQLPLLAESITTSQTSLAKKVSTAQAKEAATAPAWAYVNLAGIYDKYGQDALAGIEQLQKEMPSAGAPAEMMEMMQFYFKMLPELFKEFAGDADSITVALRPEPTILSIDTTFKAKDGSEVSKMLVANNNTAGYTLTGYLDSDDPVNALTKMNRPFMQAFYDKMFDIMAAAADDPTTKEQTVEMKVMMQKMFAAMGDEISVSYAYAGGMPPFKMQEVVEIKDVAAMKALMNEGLDYTNTMYKAMGLPVTLKYQQGVSTYKNATIDTVSFSVTESNDPNSAMMQKEMEKMYGPDGFKYYLAHTPDKFYITMGPDSDETLKALIDRPASAATPSGDIQIAMDTLKDTPYDDDFVCSVNVIKLMQGFGEMMQTMGTTAEMGPFGDIFSEFKDVQTKSCLVMGGKIADGQASARLAIPKQHLAEIVTIFMQIQQKQAAAIQQAQMQNAMPTEEHDHAAHTDQPTREISKSPLMEWVGKPAPEIKIVDLDGKIHRISRMKGKKVVLDFWATWCPPCRKSIPELVRLRAGSKETDLVVVGLSNETTDKLVAFVKNTKINYPIATYNDSDMPEPYSEISAIPTLILIDSEGIIRDVLTDYHPLDVLQSHLNEIK